jgi:hypothetical protein
VAVEDLVRAALEGRPPPRPLFAPLVSELAADIEAIDREYFLLDAGKMSKLLAELQGGAGLDVVWVSTGSHDLTEERRVAAGGAAARLRQVLGPRALVGAAITPQDFPAARTLLDAGVQVLLILGPENQSDLKAIKPLIATTRFRRALGWARQASIDEQALAAAGDPVPIVPLAAGIQAGRSYGITLTPDELDDRVPIPAGATVVTTWEAVDKQISLARLTAWRA